MALRIENRATIKVPPKTSEIIENAMDVIPREHLRGLNRVVLVDFVTPHPRLQVANVTQLPGLYHPKIANEQPYFELALGILRPSNEGIFKRFAAKLNYKANLVSLIYSLQAQHYHLTLSHGVKKHQYESVVRSYMEKYFELWRERNAGWRSKMFKPLQPFLQKWAKKLKSKYDEEQRRSKA